MTKTFTLRRAGLTLAAMIFSVVASAQTVVFDFSSEKWVNENNGYELELKEVSRLMKAKWRWKATRGGVIQAVNKLKDNHLQIPRGNSIEFYAPQGKHIAKIVFEMKKNRFHVSSDGEHDLPMLGKDANTRVWEGDAQNVRIYGINAMPYIRKATVTLIKDNTTGINDVKQQADRVHNVYNLNGIKVGTTNTFDRLPAGIYIVNAKKVVK